MAEQSPLGKRPKLSDLDLIRRARLEDTSAYEELVRRYYSTIYGLVYGMTCSRDEAEHVAQEVFVKAWKALGHFREQACFRIWIYRIALNRTNRFRKNRARRKGDCFEEFSPEVKQSELYRDFSSKGAILRKVSLSECQKKMNDALLTLTEKHRAVVVMTDVQEMSSVDISGVMGGSENTVESQLLHARNNLQRELADLRMSDVPELNLVGLLALKRFEHPSAERIGKNIQATMQAVRAAHPQPSLLLFPDKSMGWMFAQPRYGIAALFILFLVLHMCKGQVSTISSSSGIVEKPDPEAGIAVTLKTNSIPTMGIPPVLPDYSVPPPAPAEILHRSVGPSK